MSPGRQREEGLTTRRCQTRPTRIQPFCGRKGSASRASMLCVCSVAWRRGCVAWRVVWRRRGGSGACCGRGGGKEKNPSGECARAVSGRIKYGRSSSEDAQAGGASVRLPRLLYFFVVFAEQGGRVPAKLAADGGTGTTGIRWRLHLLKRLQASQCGTASIADAPRVCALQTNGSGYALHARRIFFGLSTKK